LYVALREDNHSMLDVSHLMHLYILTHSYGYLSLKLSMVIKRLATFFFFYAIYKATFQEE